MRHHSICGSDARRLWFVIAQQKLTHFHKGELTLAQSHQRFFHLVKGRDQASQVSTRLERGAHLSCVVIGIGNIQEEGIHVCFVKTLLDVTQL